LFGLEGGSGVRFKGAGCNNGFPAVLVNSSSMAQEVKLVGRARTATGHMHFDGGRKVEVQNGVAVLTIKPLEVLIVRRFEPFEKR
jgi:hypothetical protein